MTTMTDTTEREAFEAYMMTRQDHKTAAKGLFKCFDGTYLHHSTQRHWFTWQARAAIASSTQPTDEDDFTQALQERDRYHLMADELSARIAAITGEDIGEHSSANCPWTSALNAADNFIATSTQPTSAVQPGDLKRFSELHLYEEIAEHYAKCAISPEALRDWVAERMDKPSAVVPAAQPTSETAQSGLPKHNSRRLYDDTDPNGYWESDADYFKNNRELVIALLDAYGEGSAATPPPVAGDAIVDLIEKINEHYRKITPLPWFPAADARGVGLAGNRYTANGCFSDVCKESVSRHGGGHFENVRFIAELANAWPTIYAAITPSKQEGA